MLATIAAIGVNHGTTGKITTLNQCADCASCCGFECRSYDDSHGCKLSQTTHLPDPRPVTASNCYHHTHECISCTEQPDLWKSAAPEPGLTLYVSGDCHELVDGTVNWIEPLHTSGAIVGQATIRGPCPLVIAYENAVVSDVTFDCTSGEYAVSVVGKNVKLDNVRAIGASAFRAASIAGVNIDGLIANVDSTTHVIAALGHTRGKFNIN